MITDSAAANLTRLRTDEHPHCVVCSQTHPSGLRLKFRHCSDGSVEAGFHCGDNLQGYTGYLHGGVISSLLDGAMANCLFAHGVTAVTADLHVRFPHSVLTGFPARVRAWIHQSSPLLYVLKAELVQQEEIKTTAVGKFMAPVNAANTIKQETAQI